jgi:hypothetical protein
MNNNKPTNDGPAQPQAPSVSFWADAVVISRYTRAQALEDGVLVDAGTMAKEAGFTFPVALTHAVWHGFIEPDPRAMGLGQSTDGRLWDTLQCLRVAIRKAPVGQDTIRFRVLYVMATAQRKLVDLKAVCGPGDNAEPVITVMLPEED